MNLLNLISGFSLTLSVGLFAQASFNHHWPKGKDMCRGPWVGSHYYLNVKNTPVQDKKVEYTDLIEKNVRKTVNFIGYKDNQTHEVILPEIYEAMLPFDYPDLIPVPEFNKKDHPAVISKIQKVCEEAKNEIIRNETQKGHFNIKIETVEAKVNEHFGIHTRELYGRKSVTTEIPDHGLSYEYSYEVNTMQIVVIMHVDCKLAWTYDVVKKNQPIEIPIWRDVFTWEPSSKTKTSFVFKNSYLLQPDASVPPTELTKSKGTSVFNLAAHKEELQDLLTEDPLYLGIQNPRVDAKWDSFHQFTESFCTTCDDLPIDNPIQIEEKRKCLKAATYTYSGLAKGLNIENSPLVFELIYELKELYKDHLESISPDKHEEAKSFIKQYQHIKSKLPGLGEY